jgi:hypothetical protein
VNTPTVYIQVEELNVITPDGGKKDLLLYLKKQFHEIIYICFFFSSNGSSWVLIGTARNNLDFFQIFEKFFNYFCVSLVSTIPAK